MDAKDLRVEPVLGDRSNDGNTTYPQGSSVLQCNRNKPYQDIGSNSLAKVDVQTARPCAVIGPDRVVPPPASIDAYLKKGPVEQWLGADNSYRRPPEYPNKVTDYHLPTRNISPRQTFQENMQRIMVPPSYNSGKTKEDHNFPVDANSSALRNNKLNVPSEVKYCDVPYVVNPMTNEQKNIRNTDISASNINPALARGGPHVWPPSNGNIRPPKPYGSSDLYQYPEYQSCAGPRPMFIPRPHRTIHEDSGHAYSDPYYPEGSIRFKPYPTVKERYPQARYEYVGNYANSFPHPSFPPHKYDLQKSLPPHAYPGYSQVPLKYLDTRMTDPIMNGYQRSINQQANFNNGPFRNQVIHPNYGPIPGNCLQANKFYPYPPDNTMKAMASNKLPYDTSHKIYDYENTRTKTYPMSESFYVNEITRSHPMKGQVLPPNYPTINMHSMTPHAYYRKDNPTMKNFEYSTHFRNIDPSININGNTLSRLPSQFSPNTIAISPSDSSTSNDTTHTQGTSQEDCGYVSQSSSASIRSIDSCFNRMPSDLYRRYDYRYGPFTKASHLMAKSDINSNKSKKDIDVRQFLQMWNEGEDENGENSGKDNTVKTTSNNAGDINNHYETNNQEQLYVLGLVNVPSEELSKYEHIQKVSKLPENIKGYNSIELLNQFEEVIESSNLNNYKVKPPSYRDFHMGSLKCSSSMPRIGMPSRPISPLDVEAKISQSVIHKEVGCNFEIKPCSPKMLNVEIATPIQTVLGERVIEKVTNPLITQSPILHGIDENIDNCNVIKHKEHGMPSNENSKVPSCKMVNTQYSNNDTVDPLKTNYSLQDLESNSGVCLASLPRLDNDIELNFPEVNQQFINANKVESVIATASKDLPTLDTDQSKIKQDRSIQEIEINRFSPNVEFEKEFPKLSKYRKLKKKVSDVKENTDSSVQAMRTDSVIIKNPENLKTFEESSENFPVSVNETKAKSLTLDTQQDPINLTTNTDLRSHDKDIDCEYNKSSKDDAEFDIRYNSNKNFDIKNDLHNINKTNFIDKYESKENCSETNSPSSSKNILLYGRNDDDNLNFSDILEGTNKIYKYEESIDAFNVFPQNDKVNHHCEMTNKTENFKEDKLNNSEEEILNFKDGNLMNTVSVTEDFNNEDLNKTPLGSKNNMPFFPDYISKTSDCIDPAGFPANKKETNDNISTMERVTRIENETQNNRSLCGEKYVRYKKLNNQKEEILSNNILMESTSKIEINEIINKNEITSHSVKVTGERQRVNEELLNHDTEGPTSNRADFDSEIENENEIILPSVKRIDEMSNPCLYNNKTIKTPCYFNKELYSPWVQKLIIYNEGVCSDLMKKCLTETTDCKSTLHELNLKPHIDKLLVENIVTDTLEMTSTTLSYIRKNNTLTPTDLVTNEHHKDEKIYELDVAKANNTSLLFSEHLSSAVDNNTDVTDTDSESFLEDITKSVTGCSLRKLTDIKNESCVDESKCDITTTKGRDLDNLKSVYQGDAITESRIAPELEIDNAHFTSVSTPIKETNEDISCPDKFIINDLQSKLLLEPPESDVLLKTNSTSKIEMDVVSKSLSKIEIEVSLESAIFDTVNKKSQFEITDDVLMIERKSIFKSKQNEHCLVSSIVDESSSESISETIAVNHLVENIPTKITNNDFINSEPSDDSKSGIENTVGNYVSTRLDQTVTIPVTPNDTIVKSSQKLSDATNRHSTAESIEDDNISEEIINIEQFAVIENPLSPLTCLTVIGNDSYIDQQIKEITEIDPAAGNVILSIAENSSKTLTVAAACCKIVSNTTHNKMEDNVCSNGIVHDNVVESELSEEIENVDCAIQIEENENNIQCPSKSSEIETCMIENKSNIKTDSVALQRTLEQSYFFNSDLNRLKQDPIVDVAINQEHTDKEKHKDDAESFINFSNQNTIESPVQIEVNDICDHESEGTSDLVDKSRDIRTDLEEVQLKNSQINDSFKCGQYIFSKRKRTSLKRSLSDSAIDICKTDLQENTKANDSDNELSLYQIKRKKTEADNTTEPQMISESFCNIIHHNRRNSISSIYNEENVSFCILIDNNCLIAEECDEDEKICFTEIPEDCLSCIQSDVSNIEGETDSATELQLQEEMNYEYAASFSQDEQVECAEEENLDESWVEDIACVETVVSDDVAEDIIVSASTSPKEEELSDEESIDDETIFKINDHTDKVKYIYGDKMCSDDAQLVETLYRTPQMDVNKTLVHRESHITDDCNRYYDKDSLEKVLSESNNHEITPSKLDDIAFKSVYPCTAIKDENLDLDIIGDSSLSFQSKHIQLNYLNVVCEQNDDKEPCSENLVQTQDDTIHSCESSVDNVFSFNQSEETGKCTISSSPEVSSTTTEEKNSCILLKITNYGGSRIAQVNNVNSESNAVCCKYTEKKEYLNSNSNLPNRPLRTKAAQKYIPPLRETIGDLKVKLTLPQQSLFKLKQLKRSKEEPKPNKLTESKVLNIPRKELPKKPKPKFEDVLKSIDEIQLKRNKEKSKKIKKCIPKVVIKKTENGSHYASTPNKDKYNPDLTGRKWQPWVFLDKNNFIDKMALSNKTRAIFSHRKNTYVFAETFKKYKSISNTKFVISQPNAEDSSCGQLKYTIKFKHNY